MDKNYESLLYTKIGKAKCKLNVKKEMKSRNNERYNSTYIYGNTVRKINEPQNHNVENIKIVQNKSSQQNYMSIGQVVAITALLILFFAISVSRLQLQAATTASIKKIGMINTEYNQLKTENDAEYARINSKYNLFEIRDKAINELGMVYVNEERVIILDSMETNRVTQYKDIPTQ